MVEQSSNINFVLEAVGQGQNVEFAEPKVMMQHLTSDMKTHLLDSMTKLDQIIQTLKESQPK
jgi:spore coat protein CotF